MAVVNAMNISTHILTKRMTGCSHCVISSNGISTHILTKRMTGPLDEISAMCADFNSHPHEEDDDLERTGKQCRGDFNSHPHEEDDEDEITELNGKRVFQLTSSRRG